MRNNEQQVAGEPKKVTVYCSQWAQDPPREPLLWEQAVSESKYEGDQEDCRREARAVLTALTQQSSTTGNSLSGEPDPDPNFGKPTGKSCDSCDREERVGDEGWEGSGDGRDFCPDCFEEDAQPKSKGSLSGNPLPPLEGSHTYPASVRVREPEEVGDLIKLAHGSGISVIVGEEQSKGPLSEEREPTSKEGRMTTDSKRICQHLECEEEAEFVITDPSETDPYSSETDACTAHVGGLLGHNIPVADGAEDRWEVRGL